MEFSITRMNFFHSILKISKQFITGIARSNILKFTNSLGMSTKASEHVNHTLRELGSTHLEKLALKFMFLHLAILKETHELQHLITFKHPALLPPLVVVFIWNQRHTRNRAWCHSKAPVRVRKRKTQL